jgi:predicted ribosome quality control (RQC) complex YloA/Tae2 family protein
MESLLEAFRLQAAEASPGRNEAAAAILPPELLAGLEQAADAALRRRTSLEVEYSGLEDPRELRARADLLLARFAVVPPGSARVALEGFAGEPTAIDLDPGLSVQENATALYERARRSERAAERLPALIAEAEANAASFQSLLDRACAGHASVDEIREALPPGRALRRGRGDTATLLPYRRYRSSGGLEIRVGRGARHNDDLTFHHSAPGDAWMHAREASGAHVVLRWGKPGNPPARDLEEAAVLAALNSKARTSEIVPVDWTFRKHVRKPRGARPGTVVIERAKTLFVEPDPEVEKRLAGSEDS